MNPQSRFTERTPWSNGWKMLLGWFSEHGAEPGSHQPDAREESVNRRSLMKAETLRSPRGSRLAVKGIPGHKVDQRTEQEKRALVIAKYELHKANIKNRVKKVAWGLKPKTSSGRIIF